jgi:peptidyl-tRNA hydrolase, PTH2 family
MSLPHRVLIEPVPASEGGGYTASFPDLPGCMAHAETPEAALAGARDALRSWLGAAKESEGVAYDASLPPPLGADRLKQVILVRRDLNMRRGKEIAQGAHASMLPLLSHRWDPRMVRWLGGPFAKIALSVESERDLLGFADEAESRGLIVSRVRDAGRTEFGGVPTWTTVAIGPDLPEEIDPITGGLKLR